MLDEVYSVRTPDTWQWRAVANKRATTAPGTTGRAVRVSVAINYFGWKSKVAGENHYHRIIDTETMYGRGLNTVWPGDENLLVRLLRWGICLRDFCDENNLQIRPTLGSLASQFLTDPRFYPAARRKVPVQTNQRAREHLPGNYYYLNVTPDRSNNFTAYYLDQHCAHHYHAASVALPDSDHCYAYGRFTDLAHSPLRTSPAFCGLYCLDLSAPPAQPCFCWIGDNLNEVFVFSNELHHLYDAGYGVVSVRAAWGSYKCDTGLPKYARWAMGELDRHSGAAWLKPILLATYGVLATKPVNREAIFRLAKRGTPVQFKTGRRQLTGMHIESPHKLEPGIAHVIQRGMIEAATRSESVGLAQWLDSKGHRVLSIYADAVIVEADDDNPLPQLPDPWRCKQELNHLQFITHQAFMSDGMTKLPGISQELRNYQQTTPGYAPRKVAYEALTGRPISTGRRI